MCKGVVLKLAPRAIGPDMSCIKAKQGSHQCAKPSLSISLCVYSHNFFLLGPFSSTCTLYKVQVTRTRGVSRQRGPIFTGFLALRLGEDVGEEEGEEEGEEAMSSLGTSPSDSVVPRIRFSFANCFSS